MRIVILDGYTENPGDLSWEPLEALGTLTVFDRTATVDADIIRERIHSEDASEVIVITNKTPLSRQTFEQCPEIKAVAVLATGYNVVDTAAAKEHGIPVMNVPTYGTQIVGHWEQGEDFCYWDYPMIELAGKTAGIIGLGRIGQVTARIAGALGMRVVAYDAYESEAGRAVAEYVPLDTILGEADVIFLHCPLFPETEGLICKTNIDKMKDGVILINNSRGGLVVEQDLADALNSGKIYAAGLDVVSTEPILADNPLLNAKNCLITPHISWAAKEARQRILDTTAENIQSFLNGAPVNVVNK